MVRFALGKPLWQKVGKLLITRRLTAICSPKLSVQETSPAAGTLRISTAPGVPLVLSLGWCFQSAVLGDWTPLRRIPGLPALIRKPALLSCLLFLTMLRDRAGGVADPRKCTALFDEDRGACVGMPLSPAFSLFPC